MRRSNRARIRPALERCVTRLRERRIFLDVGAQRILRDYGVECIELAYRASTLPAPAGPADAEITGRYAIHHPLREDPDDE
jgi:hypothetical protein